MLSRLLMAALAAVAVTSAARAQQYFRYTCQNGASFELALFPETKAAFLQLDGKSIRLPKFVSVTGARYRRGDVTVWVKGNRATLRRSGKRTECTLQ